MNPEELPVRVGCIKHLKEPPTPTVGPSPLLGGSLVLTDGDQVTGTTTTLLTQEASARVTAKGSHGAHTPVPPHHIESRENSQNNEPYHLEPSTVYQHLLAEVTSGTIHAGSSPLQAELDQLANFVNEIAPIQNLAELAGPTSMIISRCGQVEVNL